MCLKGLGKGMISMQNAYTDRASAVVLHPKIFFEELPKNLQE
jgi:hypothetical protein